MQRLSGNMLLCLLILIGLTSSDANVAPEIGKTDFELCEDIPTGNFAFKITATDRDNDNLTYQIHGKDSDFFKMDSATGNATLIRPLNKDETGSALTFTVTVSDGLNTEPKQVVIVILDANNNIPMFGNASYDCTIPESTAESSTLFTVHATDEDTGHAGIVSYAIDNVIPKSGFDLFRIDSSGNLILNGSLSYTALSPFYQLRINATDHGGKCFSDEINYQTNYVNSLITVEDTPDIDPLFTGLPYRGSVAENSPEGTSVLQVTATDPDTGINAVLTYSIEGTTAEGLFKISASTGIITVSSQIDREKTDDVVTLTVKATESTLNIHGVHASSTAEVQINIIDVNDEKPEFYRCEGSAECVKADQFTAEVLEHSSASISFNMTVKDADRLPKTKLQLEGAHKNLFSVVPEVTTIESPVQLQVKLPQQLDYETEKEIVLHVIAIDEEKTSFASTATVTIRIIDANDNIPTFPEDTYKLNVAENSRTGTEIQVIDATDPDTMDKDKIVYRLLPDSILPYFDVQPATGLVYVKNGTLLDREGRSLYTATLQASDTDGKAGTTLLEITLTDVNDEHPVINRETYFEFVAEGQPFEMVIQADDADEPNTNNSQIVFAIQPSMYSDNFTIDPDTGVLRNNSVLDREDLEPELNGKIELNVTATDKGTPPLSDSVKVIIELEDVNDNTPEFNASSYTFSIKEGQKGAHVGSVYAVDLDQTEESNRITFSIAEGSFGSFIIRSAAAGGSYRGDIFVDPDIELDYESTRTQFNLRVEATDLGGRTAEAMVEVNVLNVNDERPEAGPTQHVTVKENTDFTGIIANFTGFDKDANHSLVFELESMQCRCNGSLTPCESFILEPTGAVRVALPESLDYEECDQAVIEAWVVDELTEKGENVSVTTAQMVITIEDVNDNPPEFIDSDSLFVVVSESASKGTSVAAVTATDNDTGVNSQIVFQVAEVKFVNLNSEISTMRSLFEVVTTQQNDIYVGIIQTTESLDISLKGKYLVAVNATDPGGLWNYKTLEIFTVDASFKVELEFTLSVTQVEQTMDAIRRALTSATDTVVEVVSIRPKTSEARNSVNTIVAAYFIYPNGTALTSDQVEGMLSHPDHYLELRALGLTYIGGGVIIPPPSNTVQYILLGILGGLLLLLIVLSITLLCTRRNYKRKLKASKAFNSAMDVKQQDGPVVPGTNKFSKEGTNPVLNIDYNTTPYPVSHKASLDADRDSISSKDSMDMEIIETRSKSDEESEDERPPSYSAPLEAALAERNQKKGSNKPRVVFINPAFSTTDL